MKIQRTNKRAKRNKYGDLVRHETILNTEADENMYDHQVVVARGVSFDGNHLMVAVWDKKNTPYRVYLSHDEVRRLMAFLPENLKEVAA